jgi:hypothetical protein
MTTFKTTFTLLQCICLIPFDEYDSLERIKWRKCLSFKHLLSKQCNFSSD